MNPWGMAIQVYFCPLLVKEKRVDSPGLRSHRAKKTNYSEASGF